MITLGVGVIPAVIQRFQLLTALWCTCVCFSTQTRADSAPGQVVGWTSNGAFQTNIPPGLDHVTAIAAAGFDDYAVKSDGTVVAWGNNSSGQTNVPPGLSNVIAIAAGGIDSVGHCIVLKQDGTVTAWGTNSAGQTNVPAGLNHVIAIAAGHYHGLALKDDHSVVGWGSWFNNTFVPVTVPASLTNVIALAGGANFSVAIQSDGTLFEWGVGSTNLPPGQTNIVAIAAGDSHCVALRSDGTVISWGSIDPYNETNTPAGLSNVVAVSAGQRHSMALKSDGSVVNWGYMEQVPAKLKNVLSIAGGGNGNGSWSLAISNNLGFSSFDFSSQNRTLQFHTVSGWHYSVESSSDLISPWLPLPGGSLSGNDQDAIVIDTNSASSSFYRIRQFP